MTRNKQQLQPMQSMEQTYQNLMTFYDHKARSEQQPKHKSYIKLQALQQ